MKKKLLILLIAVIPTLIPNMASAIAIDAGVGSLEYACIQAGGIWDAESDFCYLDDL